jgi:hypothetical protein
LLSRRPDLARDVDQQSAALELVGRVGLRSAAIDVLAGFLGSAKASGVTDLAQLLAERVAGQSQAAADEGDGAAVDHYVLAAYQLGWANLPAGPAREAVRSLAVLAEKPVPRVVCGDLPEVGPGGIEDALWAGFASLDEKDDRLVQAASLRSFVSSQSEPEEVFVGRPLRILQAIHLSLATCDIEDERYDESAEHGFDLAIRFAEYGAAGTIARRMTERLRRRGWQGPAREWSARLVGLLDAGHPEVSSLRGPSLLDRGLLELTAGHYSLARDLLADAAAEFEQAEEDGQEGAEQFLAQTRLVLGEVLLELGDRSGGDEALSGAIAALEASKLALLADEGPFEPVLRQARLAALEVSLVQACRLSACRSLALGETGTALAGLKEAWTQWCEAEGDEQPDGASFHLSLARALRAVGRDSEIDAPLEAARVLLGGDMDRVIQPTLPVALHDLAVLAGDRGEFEHAETLLVEAAMVAGGLVPESDPIHAHILYTRGLALLARGEMELADRCFVEGETAAARVEGDPRSVQLNIRAARAWARALQGPEHCGEAVRELEATERVMLHQRGPENTFVEHLKLLRCSLQS